MTYWVLVLEHGDLVCAIHKDGYGYRPLTSRWIPVSEQAFKDLKKKGYLIQEGEDDPNGSPGIEQ